MLLYIIPHKSTYYLVLLLAAKNSEPHCYIVHWSLSQSIVENEQHFLPCHNQRKKKVRILVNWTLSALKFYNSHNLCLSINKINVKTRGNRLQPSLLLHAKTLIFAQEYSSSTYCQICSRLKSFTVRPTFNKTLLLCKVCVFIAVVCHKCTNIVYNTIFLKCLLWQYFVISGAVIKRLHCAMPFARR